MSTPNPATTEWVPLAASGGPPGPAGPMGPPGPTGAASTIPGPTGPPGPGTILAGQTWSILGPITSLAALPGIYIPKLSTQTITLKGARHKTAVGSVTITIRRNGTNIGNSFTCNTTPVTTVFNQALSADDLVDVMLSAWAGNPADLILTLYIEHTAL